MSSHRLKTPVIFITKAEAIAETGTFYVSAIKIMTELGRIIREYISKEGLITFSRRNLAKTSWNWYTLNFTIREYDAGYTYITNRGATGHYNLGRPSFPGVTMPHMLSASEREEFYQTLPPEEAGVFRRHYEQDTRTPDLDRLYFWIARKYPRHILLMDYSTTPDPRIGIGIVPDGWDDKDLPTHEKRYSLIKGPTSK